MNKPDDGILKFPAKSCPGGSDSPIPTPTPPDSPLDPMEMSPEVRVEMIETIALLAAVKMGGRLKFSAEEIADLDGKAKAGKVKYAITQTKEGGLVLAFL